MCTTGQRQKIVKTIDGSGVIGVDLHIRIKLKFAMERIGAEAVK